MNTLPASLLAKVSWRLLPFLLLMYIMAFLDRANVGFAKQTFQADTGIGDAAFAFGAGVFFVGYALLEVPSNLIMHRVGARLWMCRIMVTWGLVSAAMMFAHDEMTFYVLRFLLGVAEAGFFPGVILYLTYWFPSAVRGKAMGFFYFGAPLAFIFGSPLSGLLLELDGLLGARGWQWLFAVEGLLASAVGVWAYFYLDNRPADAKWLSAEERSQLQTVLDAEDREKQRHGSLLGVLCQPAVLYLCLIYLLIQASVYGVVFYLPSQVAGLLGTKVGLMVGIVSAIPWLCALLAAWKVPAIADRSGQRRRVAALTLLISGLGIAASVSVSSPVLGILALCFAASGFIAVQPVFWTFPGSFLAGSAAAGAIALINSFGALGGFIAPILKNWAEGVFQSPAAGLYLLAVTTLIAAVLVLGIRAKAPSVPHKQPTFQH
ncbi:MFS transporter [Pseudomonas sp. DTU_2021_1001937_2_SI_NGA_ILE_001]|uniref:MFS transporter n=1 Tax=Pseudomonas sp. DTU_2021_1001937_2_SI_NGA_ILE_001 TaxID=3077589 RepID=UPI0028FC16AA|nr:MFS transporter [Pseudomonas sp. DTU_2021_1001937_2_SI_NGA_ILE_001]WNW10241.1 MFS transporter [Pseudomonas sp. DTU_2021_1001937_2_SI_NGA_ILE_001]